MTHDCVNQQRLDKQEERLNKVESITVALTERLDSLIKKLDRWANLTGALIVTTVGGFIVTVVGGITVAVVLYIIKIN